MPLQNIEVTGYQTRLFSRRKEEERRRGAGGKGHCCCTYKNALGVRHIHDIMYHVRVVNWIFFPSLLRSNILYLYSIVTWFGIAVVLFAQALMKAK